MVARVTMFVRGRALRAHGTWIGAVPPRLQQLDITMRRGRGRRIGRYDTQHHFLDAQLVGRVSTY